MYCRTRSLSLNWSRGESSFWVFQNGGRLCIFCVVFAGGRMRGGSVLQFKVFGLEVGSGAFPTSFRKFGWFVLSQVGHFGYSFLVSCPSLRRCSSFRLSFQDSSLTCSGFLQ